MTIVQVSFTRKWILDWMLIILWITSAIILGSSFYHQYVENAEFCALCKWQRLIYILIFFISPIGLISRFNLFVITNLKILFALSFCLAIYHSFVQFGWFTDRCVITQKIENINDFMLMLEQPKVSCAKISWKLFGLSVSIYNAIFSTIVLLCLTFNKLQEKYVAYKEKLNNKKTSD